MAKIPQEEIDSFREHCRSYYEENLDPGDSAVYWTIETYHPFSDGRWEFDPEDEELFNIYELFKAVGDEFEFEEEGHGSFFISKK